MNNRDPMKDARREFAVHMLNDLGKESAVAIAQVFSEALDQLEEIAGSESREMAIVRTKLEEACFFAKKAMANRAEYQA